MVKVLIMHIPLPQREKFGFRGGSFGTFVAHISPVEHSLTSTFGESEISHFSLFLCVFKFVIDVNIISYVYAE